MSIRSVQSEIKKAMKTGPFEDAVVTVREARAIVKEASKGRITSGEVKAVRTLLNNHVDDGQVMTMAVPELRDDGYFASKTATSVLSDFVKRNSPHSQPAPAPGGGQMFTLAIPENPSDMNFLP